MRRVQISRFQIDATLTDSFALRRVSSRGDSCTSPVVVVGRLASTGCQRPNDTSLGASGRKPRAARWARWLLGSPGSYVYAHMFFLSPHLPGLLPIVCDGQHRPVRRWPLFGRKRPFASWGGGGGGYVATGPNLSISNRCDFDRFFRVTTCQQPRRLLHVSSRRRRRPASEHGLPEASGQTTLLSARMAANPARLAGLADSAGLAGLADSAGLAGLVRVCTHAQWYSLQSRLALQTIGHPNPLIGG